ncbi:MAG: DUF86 domain-containing protein, partial [Chthoniobacterales bacterium]|nr:DUF86 domain-containing protein [Chthoniobacterales bacterium]
VIRRIEIIGEATAHLSEATRAQLPALPFRQMRGMRNILAHDYGQDEVTDEVGEDESHPLASFMDVLGTLLGDYETERVPELA